MLKENLNLFNSAKGDIKEKFNIKDKLTFNTLIGNFKNLLVFAICILVSTCKMTSGIAPFSLAILGAIKYINVPLAIPIAIMAVTLKICFGSVALLKFLVAAVLFVAIKSFIKLNDTKIANTSAIMFASLMAEIVALSINGVLLYDVLTAVYTTIVTGVFYLIFSEGLPVIYSYAKPKIYSAESLIASGVLLAVLVCGFGDIGVLGVTLRGVASILMVMILGWKRGAAIGAATGLSVSLVLGLMGVGSVATVATYSFCGLLAGVLARFGKVGAAIGFILGNIVLAFYSNGSTEVIIGIKEIVVASVALFIIPKKMLIVIDDLFDYNTSLPGECQTGLIEESTIYKLGAVSDVISGIADNVVKGNNERVTTDEIGSFIKTLNENTCRRCENYEKCWKNNYHKMYEMTFNAIEKLQIKGEITALDLTVSCCEHKELLIEGLNLSYELYKVNKDWQAKVSEQRSQVSMQLKEVSKELDKVKAEIKTSATLIEEEKSGPYRLEFGIAKAKKNGNTILGDSSTRIKLKDGKILIALSDGMGTGDEAARNSKKVVINLESLLNTGFEEERAVKLINSYLLVSKQEDNFATIDAMIFNPENGLANFIKIGACPTFIRTNNGIVTIESNSLPAGILGEINIETREKILKSGNVVVMVTDGVIDAQPEKNEQALMEVISAVKNTSAQRLADIILQEALDSNFGIARDDMTVIVTRVSEK